MIKFDIDRLKEILDTLTRNKSRSFLTGFGVFWGVFMLIGLIGGGKGLQEKLAKNFDGFATNSAIIFAQNTTKAYDGFRKGRAWNMNYKDVDRLKTQVPELATISPVLTKWGSNAVLDDKKINCSLKGVLPSYTDIETPKLFYGRYINEMDIQQGRKVCVIGKKIFKTLFPNNNNPCGTLIRVDSIYYKVIGVDYANGTMEVNGRTETTIVVPISLMKTAYNFGDAVHLICVTAKNNITMSKITQAMRTTIAQAHQIDPTDEKAIAIFNSEVLFGVMDNLFKGVNILVWLVGIGTLLAGAIGVSNIMMVTVRERTSEFGIRRAIGATPQNILSQIITESIILTAIAGMSGILFAVIILQMGELLATQDGILTAHFQIDFWTALGAAALISILGAAAGLLPALRAMAIKPVEAMHTN